MRIHASETVDAHEYRVFDKATGKAIPKVVWADTETRELGVLRTDSEGNLVFGPMESEDPLIEDTIRDRGFTIARFMWDEATHEPVPVEVIAETA